MYTKQEMIKCSEVCKIGDELGDTSPLVMRNDWETHAEILSGKNYISQDVCIKKDSNENSIALHGPKQYGSEITIRHSLIRGILTQSCSAGAKNFTKCIFYHAQFSSVIQNIAYHRAIHLICLCRLLSK